MKFVHTLFAVLAAAVACFSFLLSQDDIQQAFTRSSEKIKTLALTGNADNDYAILMAEHHQGSVDAARIVMQAAGDAIIKQIAYDILDKHPKEQEALRSHARSQNREQITDHHGIGTSNSETNNTFASDLKKILNSTDAKRDIENTNNKPDHRFAHALISHYQFSIDLSNAILTHGKEQKIKLIARKIRSNAESDSRKLKDWLKNNDK
jgi:uncharacterized protein (DUF305 family)